MSTALIPLEQALAKDVLLSPARQSYYNALRKGQWPWLRKVDRSGQPSKKIWVDLVEFKLWCWLTGRQLGDQRAQRLEAAIKTLEAAEG